MSSFYTHEHTNTRIHTYGYTLLIVQVNYFSHNMYIQFSNEIDKQALTVLSQLCHLTRKATKMTYSNGSEAIQRIHTYAVCQSVTVWPIHIVAIVHMSFCFFENDNCVQYVNKCTFVKACVHMYCNCV